MRKVIALMAVLLFVLCGCSTWTSEADTQETVTAAASYKQITAQEAKAMMDEQPDILILDVREQSEYDSGHIPGAVLFPVGSISEEAAAAVIPERDTVTLVYCRSGNRSKTASKALAELGYTQIYEFGGIIDWPYEVE